MNRNTAQFTIEVSSDLDFEKMVVNLNFGDDQVAILSCDNGINHLEITLLDKYNDRVLWNFDLHSFINALNLASEKLKKVNCPGSYKPS